MSQQKLLSSEDAASYINELFGLEVTTRWLERQMRERRISYFKIGGMVRFGTDDLDKLLDGARVEATEPLNRISMNADANGDDDETTDEPTPSDEEDDTLADEEEEPEPEPTPTPKPKPASRRRRQPAGRPR